MLHASALSRLLDVGRDGSSNKGGKGDKKDDTKEQFDYSVMVLNKVFYTDSRYEERAKAWLRERREEESALSVQVKGYSRRHRSGVEEMEKLMKEQAALAVKLNDKKLDEKKKALVESELATVDQRLGGMYEDMKKYENLLNISNSSLEALRRRIHDFEAGALDRNLADSTNHSVLKKTVDTLLQRLATCRKNTDKSQREFKKVLGVSGKDNDVKGDEASRETILSTKEFEGVGNGEAMSVLKSKEERLDRHRISVANETEGKHTASTMSMEFYVVSELVLCFTQASKGGSDSNIVNGIKSKISKAVNEYFPGGFPSSDDVDLEKLAKEYHSKNGQNSSPTGRAHLFMEWIPTVSGWLRANEMTQGTIQNGGAVKGGDETKDTQDTSEGELSRISGMGAVECTVNLTNRRLEITPMKNGVKSGEAVEVFLSSIQSISLSSQSDIAAGVTISCKDLWSFTLFYKRFKLEERKEKDVDERLKSALGKTPTAEDRRCQDTLEQFRKMVNVFMSSNEIRPAALTIPPLDAVRDKFLKSMQYDHEKEMKNLKVTAMDTWRMTDANVNFGVCESYPQKVMVPHVVSDSHLVVAASVRAGRCFPCLTYCHGNGACLLRSSARNPSENDELEQADHELVASIRTSVKSGKLKIFNCGKRKCKYQAVECVTLNVPSLDTISKAYEKLSDLSGEWHEIKDREWLKKLDKTGWLACTSAVTAAAVEVAKAVQSGTSVIVQDEFGTDACAMISSLAQLFLNKNYRKIDGFRDLVEKEWLAFGHRFADRMKRMEKSSKAEKAKGDAPNVTGGEKRADGLRRLSQAEYEVVYGKSPKGSDMACPVFLVWLDCVHQYMENNPAIFEFSDELLHLMYDASTTDVFGTFLFNTPFQRAAAKTNERTLSVWSYLEACKSSFVNPYYAAGVSQAVLSAVVPSSSLANQRFWTQFFWRHDGEFAGVGSEAPKEFQFDANKAINETREHKKLAVQRATATQEVVDARLQKNNLWRLQMEKELGDVRDTIKQLKKEEVDWRESKNQKRKGKLERRRRQWAKKQLKENAPGVLLATFALGPPVFLPTATIYAGMKMGVKRTSREKAVRSPKNRELIREWDDLELEPLAV